jgi:transcription elongation factor Elf1
MTPNPVESEGSRVAGVQRSEGEPAAGLEVVKSQKKVFVCPNCNQKKKSQQTSRSSVETTETVVRPSKSGSKVCKKCRKAAEPVASAAPITVEKKRRRSVVVFNPHWTHYCFLLAIYLVFSVILYFMTLKQQQQHHQ